MFDDILPAYHTQQHTMQLQSIAHNNYVPLSYPTPSGHGLGHSQGHSNQSHSAHTTPHSANSQTTPVQPTVSNNKKRNEPPLTPTASVDGSEAGVSYFAAAQASALAGSSTSAGEARTVAATDAQIQEPPKKKRRVALTRIGDLER